nr:hypothetical protein [Prevotella sp.]
MLFGDRMIELVKEDKMSSEEYSELENRRNGLKQMINKYQPIFLERTEMIKDIKRKHS